MTPTPQRLTEDLAAVTAPFPAETAARLRGELQGHVLEAAEALADQGDPTPTETALHDLGSVCEVHRALERQHYTGAEEEVLLACRFAHLKRSSPLSLTLGAAIILAWPFLLQWLERPITWGLYGTLGTVFLASAILERWVRRWQQPRVAGATVPVRGARRDRGLSGSRPEWGSDALGRPAGRWGGLLAGGTA